MHTVKFYGAAGEVTGSNFILSGDNDVQVLVDLGMFQGSEELEAFNYHPLAFDPRKLTSVVLTHAHLDHCGRLPLLVRNGYRGKLYMTPATASLVELTLLDSAKIVTEDHPDHPLYSIDDVDLLLRQIITVEYGEPFSISHFDLMFRDAGHILGSAIIEITDTRATGRLKKIVFSGDLGNSPEDIVRPTDTISYSDIVVMESTYGDRLHPKEDATEIIHNEINTIEKTGGTLLIPAFSVDRTQEILHKINHLKFSGKVALDTPVFLDSPMAIKATMIYEQFRNLYGTEMSNHAKTGDPFNFPGLSMTEHGRESFKIRNIKGPKVIMAGNGMMMGGRIMRHAVEYLPHTSTRLLIVGYQAEDTVGRAILEGAKEVSILGHTVPVKATITNASSMSAHADQNQLISWLSKIKDVKRVYLVHGEDTSRVALAARIKSELHITDVRIPQMDQVEDISA